MCDERNKLKIDLTTIRDNDYNLSEGKKATDYLGLMLKYIGDPDPELRDDLIYMTFVTWIEIKNYFSNDELYSLLTKLISDDYLFYNIGTEGDDSVLKRSFSSLIISCILYKNSYEDFLDKSTVLKTFNLIVKYFNTEKDLRGFDPVKGWLHALAHTSDGFHSLLNQPKITEDKALAVDCCKEILSAIANRLCEGKEVFNAEEYERFLTPIFWDMVSDSLISTDYICIWIDELGKVVDFKDRYIKFKARTNVKNFTRSFYFRIFYLKDVPEFKNKDAVPALTESILKLEKKVNIYSRI